jgi:hypothetical protein
MDWLDVVIRLLPFLFAGGVLLALVRWLIEKRRQRLYDRRSLVSDWRRTLVPAFSQAETQWFNKRTDVLSSSSYSSIRPHLSDKARQMFESERSIFIGELPLTKKLNEEIGRIEADWRLI